MCEGDTSGGRWMVPVQQERVQVTQGGLELFSTIIDTEGSTGAGKRCRELERPREPCSRPLEGVQVGRRIFSSQRVSK